MLKDLQKSIRFKKYRTGFIRKYSPTEWLNKR